jgi:hypothetical protein
MNTENTAFTHAGFDWDLHSMPRVSLINLVKKGLSHSLGNEVSSKVGAHFKGIKKEDGTEGDVPASDDPAYVAKRDELRTAMVASILDGSIGEGRGPAGPKLTPFERRFAKIVKDELVAKLRQSGVIKGSKLPADEQVISVKGKDFTWAALQTAYGNSHKARIEKEVKAQLAAEEKKAKAIASEELDLGDLSDAA